MYRSPTGGGGGDENARNFSVTPHCWISRQTFLHCGNRLSPRNVQSGRGKLGGEFENKKKARGRSEDDRPTTLPSVVLKTVDRKVKMTRSLHPLSYVFKTWCVGRRECGFIVCGGFLIVKSAFGQASVGILGYSSTNFLTKDITN